MPKRTNRRIGEKEPVQVSSHNAYKISRGHAIENFVQLQTFCGQSAFQWHYGQKNDIRCARCIKVIDGVDT